MAKSSDRARTKKDAAEAAGKKKSTAAASKAASGSKPATKPKRSSTKPRTSSKPRTAAETSNPRRPRESDAQFGRFRVSWMLVVVVGVVILGALTLAPSVSLLIEQRQDIARLEAQVAQQQEQVDALGDQVAQWDDPAYVEAQARDRLFYVYPGETSYVVIDDRTDVDQAGSQTQYSAELQTGAEDWVQAGIGSILVSGLTTQTPDDLVPSTEEATP